MDAYRTYAETHALFYTSALVLAELYTRLMYDFNKRTCAGVIQRIHQLQEQGDLKVFQLDAALFAQAEKVLLKFSEHKLSFTDASIYVTATLYEMDEIFTLDQDFRKVGLRDTGIR